MQLHLGAVDPAVLAPSLPPATTVVWWRTYSPPVWLLDGSALETVDLMGMPFPQLLTAIANYTGSCGETATIERGPATESGTAASISPRNILVVAPRSSRELDPYRRGEVPGWRWEELWTAWQHLNLDDMDWGEDGVAETLGRAVGRKGLTVWRVGKVCQT